MTPDEETRMRRIVRETLEENGKLTLGDLMKVMLLAAAFGFLVKSCS